MRKRETGEGLLRVRRIPIKATHSELSPFYIEAEEVDGWVSDGLDEAEDGETLSLDRPPLDLAGTKRPGQL